MWLARNLKLEVTEYSKLLYSLEGDGGGGNDDDNDDDDGGGVTGGGSESTPSYHPRKRCTR